MIEKKCICCGSKSCVTSIKERLIFGYPQNIKSILADLHATSQNEFVCDRCWSQYVLKGVHLG